MGKIAVIALGGNSIIREKEKGTIQEQLINSDSTNKCLIELVKKGYDLIITHGNGPQVGNILLRNEAANKMYDVPVMPLDVCVADSEGGMGYMLQRSMFNMLKKAGIKKNVVTVVTQVAVSKDDPAFKNPSKPVGPFYNEERAKQLKEEKGWDIKEDPGRGYRRVVPSPNPVEIVELENVKALVENGNIVIAAGGGGVPVCYNEDGTLEAIEAVIDKDLASSLLARNLNADLFMILTGVPKIAVNFRKENEEWLDEMTVEQAEKYIEEGQFPAGSMGPKVKAAVNYVKHCGREVVITAQEELQKEKFGTVIKK